MIRLVTAILAVTLLQATSTFAGSSLGNDALERRSSVEIVKSTSHDVYPSVRPSLSSSEISAIQYREPLSFRCQTRAGIFAVTPERPVDTACVVDGLPGFILP